MTARVHCGGVGDAVARGVWLHIRDAGGWHGRHEIAAAFGLRGAEKIRLAAALRRLERDGHLARRGQVYGVTARCYPLPGYTLVPAGGGEP